jgi:hypothetical protein
VASGARPLVSRVTTGVIRLLRYLAPLLRDAVLHLLRLAMDAADGAQYVWRRWRASRQADGAVRLAAWRSLLRERRGARWAAWRSQTIARRVEVSAASIALVLIALIVVRSASDTPPDRPAAMAEAPEPRLPLATAADETPAVDLPRAIARMRSDMADARSGREVFLAGAPVLAPGPGGAWSGFRVAAPAALREGDGFRLWYRGCRLHGFEQDCAIGHARSSDGLEWMPSPAPVLIPGEGVDEFDLGWVTVSRVRDRYFLWYSVAPDAFDARPTSVIHLATSADGLVWQDQGRVLTSDERTVPVQPSVAHDGGQFHLWFTDDRRNLETGYELPQGAPFLRHFTSQDGRSWRELGQFPLGPLGLGRTRVSLARSSPGSYRAFFFSRVDDDGTGAVASSVGWLGSVEGTDWRILQKRSVDPGALGGDVRQITDATGVDVAGGALVWFVVQRADDRLDLRAAFYKE